MASGHPFAHKVALNSLAVMNSMIAETFFFGIHFVVVMLSAYLHWARKRGMGAAHVAIFGVTMLLFALTTTYWALSITSRVAHLEVLAGVTAVPDKSFVVQSWLSCFIFILSDLVVMWRAWGLWEKDNRKVMILPSLLLGGSIVATFVLGVFRSKNHDAAAFEIADFDRPRMGPIVSRAKIPANAYLLAFLFSLLANLSATGLIGWKAMHYRKILRMTGTQNRTANDCKNVLALLVESGIVLGILQFVLVILVIYVQHGPTPTHAALDGSFIQGFNSYFNAMVVISGTMPALIVVLVATRRSCLGIEPTSSSSAVLSTRWSAQEPYHPPQPLRVELPKEGDEDGNSVFDLEKQGKSRLEPLSPILERA